jgi:serine/threonine-protein kinase
MGRIFLGRTTGIGGFERTVVIKTLEVPLTAESDPVIAMFLDEARLLGLLHHQHIASVFEVGRDDDRHYMVLDYVEGHSAHDVWERALAYGAALPLDFSLTVVSAAANGLHYTHTRRDLDGAPLGIVHRDVTPSNVMIGHDGAVKLIDFGIAMAANRKTKTQTGFVKGKVSYLSPEQVSGREVDARTDVFALGILLYELTTLQRAFRDSSDLATMQRIKAGKLVPPSQLVDDYPRELEAIVMKALQVDPRNRFSDADAMRRSIEALGHRLRFVLGDAAVIEVMSQLFESQAPGTVIEPAARPSDPVFEWVASEHDLTVRRDPKELLEAMRAEELAEAAARPVARNAMKPRKLRAATEAAEALIVQSIDVSSPPELPLASPPPTPIATPLPAGSLPPGNALPASAVSVKFVAPYPAAAMPVAPATGPAGADSIATAADPAGSGRGSRAARARIGASQGTVRPRRWLRIAWIAAAALGVWLAAVGFFVLRDQPGPPVGSDAPAVIPPPAPPAPPAAARAPQVAPAPSKPAHPAAPPTLPTTVRVQIVTRPSDATVYLDGKKLGHTPFDETLAADTAKHVFRLRRRGYASARLELELSSDITEELVLTPQR